jgi:transcriptional regulator with XRE-family HTH domain/tetratricopeptide (TPR) repeat protein
MPAKLGTGDEMGLAVRLLRRIRGWRQHELAAASGVSLGALKAIERGRRPTTLNTFGPLTSALAVTPSTIADVAVLVRKLRIMAGREELCDGEGMGPAAPRIVPATVDLRHEVVTLVLEQLAGSQSQSSDLEASRRPAPGGRAGLAICPEEVRREIVPDAELGLALAFLRCIRGWKQTELGTASGISLSEVKAIERGGRPNRPHTLGPLIAALGVTPSLFGEVVSLVRRVRGTAACEEPCGGKSRGLATATRVPALPDLRRDLATLVRAQLAGTRGPAGISELEESRRQAPLLWARLEACAEAGRRDVVRERAEFQTAGLCELLCEKSRGAAGDSAEHALYLAELAVLAAEGVAGTGAWRWRVEGYARAHLANTLRVGGDLPAAARELARAEELWTSGAAEDPGLLNEARVLHLQASLLREQRLLSEALAVLDRALAVDRWGETPSLLMGKAKALEELSRFDAAIALLRRAASMVDGERELRTLFVVRAQLLANLCHLGRHGEASVGLAEVRALALRLSNELDLLRVDWLQGKIAAGMGRAEEALALLERVRAAFEARENAYDAALVTLELAEVHAALGHTTEVKALARESAPIFHAQGVHREARRALALFCQAAEREAATAELLRSLIVYLYRAQRDPELRFEAPELRARRP